MSKQSALSSIAWQPVLDAAFQAGEAILKVYDTDFEVTHKADDSPLTRADQCAHNILVKKLQEHYPTLPVLSEEGQTIAYEDRMQWERFWCIDPLDGTKEFVKRNGEFTVNIALIEGTRPILGVIYAPVLDIMYIGDRQKGAYKIENFKSLWQNASIAVETVGQRLPYHTNEIYTVVASRSHMSKETEAFIVAARQKHKAVKRLSAGSSLKLCLVAEGKADAYPRYAPTMEWDTAAGQAIVEAAGGHVTIYESTAPLQYNKEDLHNPWFLVEKN
ncbi:3'(2'),5'-bisphosphate nucleotidase CysQ [Pullulanibacillus camelliae]|uniref:3'(2'),5'-bisphosphate nucleotidase CysQ n=1 Tax=Pullulanibacillus camelliae TaxID=1707096 RepID=A0A8J2YMD6_9BACL|nr:3'(2'),5'-bisphosphate nucleotidase CysQ [Pullulanibacillus camelliae]GGE54791.1 3'(2'),5'-bisphosphate nucleotidase CysQ [Pullulanibacillus camelliae]